MRRARPAGAGPCGLASRPDHEQQRMNDLLEPDGLAVDVFESVAGIRRRSGRGGVRPRSGRVRPSREFATGARHRR